MLKKWCQVSSIDRFQIRMRTDLTLKTARLNGKYPNKDRNKE